MTPIYKCILVREGEVGTDKANTPDSAIEIANAMLADSPVEQFLTIMLDTKLRPIGSAVVSVGLLDQAMVHPREVFRAAIIANAKAIILAHNHPSGDLAPSAADIAAHEQLKKAGEILGVDVIDSIIVDGMGGGYSMRQQQ